MTLITGDDLRYFLVGRQAAKDVAAATMVPLDDVTKLEHKPNLTKEVPAYLRNARWKKRKGRSKTRYEEVTLDLELDATEIGWILCSGAGPPTGPTAHVFSFLFGQSQQKPISATNSMYLTLQWGEGLAFSWQLINARVSKMSVKYDSTGVWMATITFVGPKATKISQVDPVYDPPVENTPFQPWQTYITNGGVAFCVVSFSLDIDNHLDPFYCSPLALPTAGQDHGLAPNRFTEGDVEAKYKLLCEFVDYVAGDPFYDFNHDVNENWVLVSVDPDTDIATGVHPKMEIDAPKLFGTAGQLQRDKPNVLQSIDGEALFDDPTGSGILWKLTNALVNYNGS